MIRCVVVLIIFQVFLWKVCSADVEYIVIDRTIDEKDEFKIPSSKCYNDDMERQCNSMGGKQLTYTKDQKIIKVACTCKCDFNNTNNIFGFFDNTWKCGSSRFVRRTTGRLTNVLTFDGRTYDSPILVTPKSIFVLIVGKIIIHNVTYHRCDLSEHFSYLDCNSTWKSMSHKSALDGFTSQQKGWPSVHYINIYRYLMVGGFKLFYHQKHVYGHVIKLGIVCVNFHTMTYNTYDVLLKINGVQTCPALLPKMSPIMVTSTYTSNIVSKKHTSNISSKNHTTTAKPASMARYSDIPPSLHKTMAQNKEDKAADRSGLIPGVIGGIAAFAVIAIIVILIVILKSKKRHSSTREATPEFEGVENPGHSINTDSNLHFTGQRSHGIYAQNLGVAKFGGLPASPSNEEGPGVCNPLSTVTCSTYNPNGDVTERNTGQHQGPFHDVPGGPRSIGAPFYKMDDMIGDTAQSHA